MVDTIFYFRSVGRYHLLERRYPRENRLGDTIFLWAMLSLLAKVLKGEQVVGRYHLLDRGESSLPGLVAPAPYPWSVEVRQHEHGQRDSIFPGRGEDFGRGPHNAETVLTRPLLDTFSARLVFAGHVIESKPYDWSIESC